MKKYLLYFEHYQFYGGMRQVVAFYKNKKEALKAYEEYKKDTQTGNYRLLIVSRKLKTLKEIKI